MKSSTPSSPQRFPMLDVARFYGMVLVYYGHTIETVMQLENATAALHYKFIYSFHMPFFFLLSGMVLKETSALQPPWPFIKRMARSRLVPYFAFSLLLLLTTFFFKGTFLADLSTAEGYIGGLIGTVRGFPLFNIPLWFLACLISVEVLHRLTAPLVRTTTGLLAVAAVCYLGGYWINREYSFLVKGMNYWFLNEAPVAYAFYLLGIFMRRHGILTEGSNHPRMAGYGIIGMLLVFFTFNLNQGPFRLYDAVVIVLGGHGNVLLFPFTALAGSLGLLALSGATGRLPWLEYLGRNAITLFCLNGIFYHYLNARFASWYVKNFSGEPLSVFLAGCTMTALSLGACVPLVMLVDRHLPFLIGRRKTSQ